MFFKPNIGEELKFYIQHFVDIKALEDELDHLQSALDHLERKNDNIHAELIELLQSNREARKQLQESRETEAQSSK